MTVFTNLYVNGSLFVDYKIIQMQKTVGDANVASNISVTLDSPFGRHRTDFLVGGSLVLYADNLNAGSLLFNGVVEQVRFQNLGTTERLMSQNQMGISAVGQGATQGISEEVILTGKDYTLRLQDILIQPVVYTNQEISSIIKSILSSNAVPNITTNNVQNTGVTLSRIAYNYMSVFDALVQLAGLTNVPYFWYVDVNKDLHFAPKSQNLSSLTLDNTNIIKTVYDNSRMGMANQVFVYGDRYLVASPTEVYNLALTSGLNTIGTNVGAGLAQSGVILNYNPNNTQISYLGSLLVGDVFNQTNTPTSGHKYGVSFNDKLIVFYSGANFGGLIPFPTTGSLVVNYNRSLPIIKYGQNDLSIQLYGPKMLRIQDTSIKDPKTAVAVLNKQLIDSNPLNRVQISFKGWQNINPGDFVTVNLSDFNLTTQLNVLEVDYNFDKNSIQNETVQTAIFNKKFLGVTDIIKKIDGRVSLIEGQQLSSSDIYTRLFVTNGSAVLNQGLWQVFYTHINNSFILGNLVNGKLGAVANNALGDFRGFITNSFKLDIPLRGRLDYNYLASSEIGAFLLFASGMS